MKASAKPQVSILIWSWHAQHGFSFPTGDRPSTRMSGLITTRLSLSLISYGEYSFHYGQLIASWLTVKTYDFFQSGYREESVNQFWCQWKQLVEEVGKVIRIVAGDWGKMPTYGYFRNQRSEECLCTIFPVRVTFPSRMLSITNIRSRYRSNASFC